MRLSDSKQSGLHRDISGEEQIALPLDHVQDDGDEETPYPCCPDNVAILMPYLASLAVEDPESQATVLLKEFDTLPDMFGASYWRLRKAVGPRLAKAIRSTKAVLEASHLHRAADRPIVGSTKAVIDFLQTHSGYLRHERITALFLSDGLRLLKVQVLAEGEPGYTDFSLSAVLRWGLDVGAAAFILVHNHPSGDPTPSLDDKKVTARLGRLANALEMPMLQHIIVARGKVAFVDLEPHPPD